MIDPEREKIKSIFEAMIDGVYVIDGDFNINYMNDTMMKYFGQGIGRKCYQVLFGEDKACPWCRADEVFAGKTSVPVTVVAS